MPPPPSNAPPEVREFGRFAGLGLSFAAAIAVFGAAGWGLDSWLGTKPWLMVAGILLGAVAGFVKIVKSVPPARAVHPSRPYLEDPPDEREDAE